MSSFPSTIKAIGVLEQGDLEKIQLLDAPFPTPKSDELIIKVEYAGVNYIDTYHRSGLYPAPSFPFHLGQEPAGTIVALPTSEEVLNDPEYKLRSFQIGDRVAAYHGGAYAEYVAVNWIKTFKLPDGIETKLGAAILQGLTALTFATEAHEIKKGEYILIYAAAGGVGSILTQIAVQKGATVIATVSSESKAQIVRGYGAHHVLISTQQNVADEVLRITGGEGVHGIFDGIGKDTFEDDLKIARRKGTIVSLGNASGAVPPFAPLRLAAKNLKLLRPTLTNYIYTGEESRRYGAEFFELLSKGSVKVTIFKEYPFTAEGVKQSQIDITSRGTVGKLLVKVA
ncbi:hypothetical protein FRC03_001082 [Tulasnella sp. 419]|nr:hypothetical protein FRC03_001082 [Tulasnella sp. 419]